MRTRSTFSYKFIIVASCLAILIISAQTPIAGASRPEWIKPGTYVRYSKEISFVILDNQTLQLSRKLSVLNFSSCLEDSIYKVITYSELGFAMVKEILNISVNDNPFCKYLNIIDEGSRATSISDSEVALVFSWYTIPSFQRKIIDKDGYYMPWYSGIYIFFTPSFIAEIGSEFNDYLQNNLDARHYGVDAMIDSTLRVKYNVYTGFLDKLVYIVTLYFKSIDETSYMPALQISLRVELIETNIPIEKIEFMERLKLPLIIVGVSLGVVAGIIVLRIKLKKYLR